MLLTESNIAFYLMDKGLITNKSIVEGKFTAHVADSRNNNFVINRDFSDQSQYFIKQVKALDKEKTDTLRIEATCYWLANNDDDYQALKAFLPKYYDFDYLNHILIIENLSDCISLHEYFLQKQNISLEIAHQQAEVLASYHGALSEKIQQSQSMKLFAKGKPWVFSIASQDYTQWMATTPKAEQQTMQLILGNKEFLSLIQALENTWQTKSLVHNDIKFTNFLVNKSVFEEQKAQIRLIDWELADIGDPCWDIAAMFCSYLMLWVQNSDTQYHYLPMSFSPEALKPAFQEFWKTYTQKMDLSKTQSQEMLLKSMKFCGLKLIHTCFETTPYTQTLQPQSAKLLQLSLNILKAPEQSISSLLGL